MKDIPSLLPCPSCGGEAIYKKEPTHKGIEYARIICHNNEYKSHPNRCYMKTIAAPVDCVIKTWNTRTPIAQQSLSGSGQSPTPKSCDFCNGTGIDQQQKEGKCPFCKDGTHA